MIMSNPIRRITPNLSCTVPCYTVEQIFFSASPRGNIQLSKLSIGTKVVVKMVFCTVIVVVLLNPFSKDNMIVFGESEKELYILMYKGRGGGSECPAYL